jgi:uncharacterized membrane protein YphA (DoxX/SURF4 family)
MTNAISRPIAPTTSPSPARPAGLPKMAYWLTTGLVAIAFIAPGVGNLARLPHIAADMAHLGYPPYVMSILGVWKILGAVAILVPGFPRVKEWAYAGMIFDLTGAAVSRMVVGDGVVKTIIPIAIASVVIASWALRRRTQNTSGPR